VRLDVDDLGLRGGLLQQRGDVDARRVERVLMPPLLALQPLRIAKLRRHPVRRLDQQAAAVGELSPRRVERAVKGDPPRSIITMRPASCSSRPCRGW